MATEHELPSVGLFGFSSWFGLVAVKFTGCCENRSGDVKNNWAGGKHCFLRKRFYLRGLAVFRLGPIIEFCKNFGKNVFVY